MKLNLINAIANNKEIVISFDVEKRVYEIGELDLKTLDLKISER